MEDQQPYLQIGDENDGISGNHDHPVTPKSSSKKRTRRSLSDELAAQQESFSPRASFTPPTMKHPEAVFIKSASKSGSGKKSFRGSGHKSGSGKKSSGIKKMRGKYFDYGNESSTDSGAE